MAQGTERERASSAHGKIEALPASDAGLIAIAGNGPILAADLPVDLKPSEEKWLTA
jgi:hypothetical protein